MTDTFGHTYGTPLARYDRDSQSWRTSEDTSLWDLPTSLVTLPTWGMTQGGDLFELPTPERPTSVPEFSSLPTPRATPAMSEALDITLGMYQRRGGTTKGRLEESIALLPTPAVNDMGGGKTIEWWDEWAPRQKSSDGRPAPHGKSLAIEALRMTLTGENISKPSTDGKHSADPHHVPPSATKTGELDSLPFSWNG
jgi:hypothetical protein